MCGFSPRRRFFLSSPPSYQENTEFIQHSNKCSVLEEREDWQGMECRWATQIPNLSLATATIKRKSVNTETIRTAAFCYGLFFSCKENPWHPKWPAAFSVGSIGSGIWGLMEGQSLSVSQLFSNWRNLDCFWCSHGWTVVVTLRLTCLFIICEF